MKIFNKPTNKKGFSIREKWKEVLIVIFSMILLAVLFRIINPD